MEKQIELLGEKLARESQANGALTGELAATMEHVAILENKLAALELEVVERPRHITEDHIAFSVESHQNFGPVTVDTNIPFEVVRTNVGGAWQAHINSFFAPRAGLYLFSTSFRGNAGGPVYSAIVHTTASEGSERTASLYSPSDLHTGDANTVILEVDVGDLVSVQLLAEGSGTIESLAANVFSTFTGFFLFP